MLCGIHLWVTAQPIILYDVFENDTFGITATSPKG